MHSELLLREFLYARILKTRERQGQKLAYGAMNQVVDRSSFTSSWNLESCSAALVGIRRHKEVGDSGGEWRLARCGQGYRWL